MMRNILVLSLILLVGGVFTFAEHTYVGPEKCKMCHKVQYTSWAATKHAKAWESLKPAEQTNAKCNGCHSTKLPEYTGVSCEACHGPGSDFWKMSVMKDQKLAVQNGLVIPDEKVCVRCHNKQSPTFKGFNFAEAKNKVHEHKAK
jgi:hypothetical protein